MNQASEGGFHGYINSSNKQAKQTYRHTDSSNSMEKATGFRFRMRMMGLSPPWPVKLMVHGKEEQVTERKKDRRPTPAKCLPVEY